MQQTTRNDGLRRSRHIPGRDKKARSVRTRTANSFVCRLHGDHPLCLDFLASPRSASWRLHSLRSVRVPTRRPSRSPHRSTRRRSPPRRIGQTLIGHTPIGQRRTGQARPRLAPPAMFPAPPACRSSQPTRPLIPTRWATRPASRLLTPAPHPPLTCPAQPAPAPPTKAGPSPVRCTEPHHAERPRLTAQRLRPQSLAIRRKSRPPGSPRQYGAACSPGARACSAAPRRQPRGRQPSA